MRLGNCLHEGCTQRANYKFESRLCNEHIPDGEPITKYRREGLNTALKICRAVSRRMPERDRVALSAAIDEIRIAIKKQTIKRRRS